MTSVTIGNNVTYIARSAFAYCSGLTSVVIPDSVTYLGWHAFDGCEKLRYVKVGDGIEINAFQLCDNLKNVYFVGTELDFERIEIPDYKSSILSTITWYCYSENVPSETGKYWHYVGGIPTLWE